MNHGRIPIRRSSAWPSPSSIRGMRWRNSLCSVRLSHSSITFVYHTRLSHSSITLVYHIRLSHASITFVYHMRLSHSSTSSIYHTYHTLSHLAHSSITAFLPVDSYGFKFVVQADFIVASSRSSVDSDSAWSVGVVYVQMI